MKNRIRVAACSATMFLVACAGAQAQAGQKMRLLSDQKLAKLLPAKVFLDGENVPTQKRNAVVAQLPESELLLVSLIDTTGYSADYQEKYIGVVLAPGAFTTGPKKLDPGAYGFGTKKIASSGRDSVTLYLCDLGDKKVAEVLAERQQSLRPLEPLQIIVAEDGSARLYLGPYFVSLSGR